MATLSNLSDDYSSSIFFEMIPIKSFGLISMSYVMKYYSKTSRKITGSSSINSFDSVLNNSTSLLLVDPN
jgi:hypothetical protein